MLVLGAVTVLARMINLPRVYDLSLTLAVLLQGYGEVLGLYDRFVRFDDLVHFTLPMLMAPVIYIALARLNVVPDPREETHLRHYIGIGIVTVSLGIAVGAIWEIYEWRSDAWFGTDLSEGNADTNGDLVRDTLGSLAGASLLVVGALRLGIGPSHPGRELPRGGQRLTPERLERMLAWTRDRFSRCRDRLPTGDQGQLRNRRRALRRGRSTGGPSNVHVATGVGG